MYLEVSFTFPVGIIISAGNFKSVLVPGVYVCGLSSNCLQAPADVLIIQWTDYSMKIVQVWDFLVFGPTQHCPHPYRLPGGDQRIKYLVENTWVSCQHGGHIVVKPHFAFS